MSYILDALKRAESERSRGAVPNIHVPHDAMAGRETTRHPAVRVGIAAVVLLALLAAAWAWWFAPEPAGSSSARPGASVTDPVPTSAAQPIPRDVGPATTVAQPAGLPEPVAPVAVPVQPPMTPTRRPDVSVGVPTAAPAVARPRPRTVVPDARSATTVPAVAASSARPETTAPGSEAGEERVYAVKELPDEIRGSLPTLTIGGATYSENASSRMLIVNGALFHEGDKLTPEVTLQQIKLRTAVLSYRGYRYFISY